MWFLFVVGCFINFYLGVEMDFEVDMVLITGEIGCNMFRGKIFLMGIWDWKKVKL